MAQAPSRPLLTLFHMRPGEARRIAWVGLIGACYAAATALGDDVSQAVFVARAGADALPRMFLLKGLLDVAAAAVYVPLARGRRAGTVWRLGLAIYAAATTAGWAWARTGTVAGAYGLYVMTESAWTILTMHWAVLILEAFDANQARRLFPTLFACTRVGGIGAGAVLGALATRASAIDLLFVSVAMAGLSALLSYWFRHRFRSPGAVSVPPRTTERRPRRSVLRSPLVRAIALSTASMVLVRYGLRVVTMSEINGAYHFDEDLVARFLGDFRVSANLLGAVLGVLVVPKLLTWIGVGAVNVLYAVATLAAYAGLVVSPSLATAALGRFTEQQLKDAARTPLSALFYGAEPASLRAPARAFMFGAIIPTATTVTAITFELISHRRDVHWVAVVGAAVAAVFVALSWSLNRHWRGRIRTRLDEELAGADLSQEAVDLARAHLAPELLRDPDGTVDAAARALASDDPHLSALGEEVLAETISRRRAQAVAITVRKGARGDLAPGE